MEKEEVAVKMVVIGGSAGSLETLLKIVSALPGNSGACFVIVIHRKFEPDSILLDLLSTKTSMPVKEVEDKEMIWANTVYLAPPDYHLLVEDRHSFSLDVSEKIQYSRPSIDVTFESAASVLGDAVIAVLLSGANSDGAAGMVIVKEQGGYTIVQDPSTADVPFMPNSALEMMKPDAVVETTVLPAFIAEKSVSR